MQAMPHSFWDHRCDPRQTPDSGQDSELYVDNEQALTHRRKSKELHKETVRQASVSPSEGLRASACTVRPVGTADAGGEEMASRERTH